MNSDRCFRSDRLSPCVFVSQIHVGGVVAIQKQMGVLMDNSFFYINKRASIIQLHDIAAIKSLHQII